MNQQPAASPNALSPSALSEAETHRLAGLSASVIGASNPVEVLLRVLQDLEAEQNPALAAAVYESVLWRVGSRHYWVYFRMARAYEALGPSREDAAYLMAAMAVQMEPDWAGSSQLFRDMFRILRRRDRPRDAIEVFSRELDTLPEKPAAEPHEIAPLLAAAHMPLPGGGAAPPAPDSRQVRRVIEAETRPAWTCPVFGGDLPYSLRHLTAPMRRPAIDVAELHDAEVLLCNDTVVVVDRAGVAHQDLSVAGFPHHVRRKVERLAGADAGCERHAVDAAVVISDRYPPPNLCHFLLDQITRLCLYQRAGVDTRQTLVIGPEPQTDYQRRILARAGVSRVLGSDRVARVRVGRLWVSSSCRELCHAAHLGADWAVSFARDTLGGGGTRGWRRLYVSRGDVTARQVRNEAAVMALLEPHGFELIQPGRMSYDAQVAAFRQASHVIGPHGAALTHIVLCPPGAHVLEMFHPLYGTSAFAMQAAGIGLNYAAMVARDAKSDAPEWNDPTVTDVHGSRFLGRHMRVDLSVLQAYLATVL